MTVTLLDAWHPNNKNQRLVTKRVTVAFTAESAAPTAADLGLASILDVSNAINSSGVVYAGAVAADGSALKFFTDGAGAAWTGASPTVTSSFTFAVTGINLGQ